jgi:hypothetical protein
MIRFSKFVVAAALAAFFMAPAQAQNPGTVTDHAFALGRGGAVGGFRSLICGTTQVPIGQTGTDPICAALSGDLTMTSAGVTAIGASKVANSQLATMAANTTKCNATAGTANPTDCTAATMRTNMGVVIGANVEAWDADLDCLAALSSTGVLSRTGAGTCSAGALALSGLATGTQDTVIGYFGSTTASATAISNCTGSLTYSTATHTFGCNASAGTGTVTSVVCGTGLTGGTITTTGTCALAYNSATFQGSPANPTGTTSLSDVMMGVGSTCKITPAVSGRVKIEVFGAINSTGGFQSTAIVKYGTGSAPANAAAVSGTSVGNTTVVAGSGTTNLSTPFANGGIITGLTVGTQIWIDLAVHTSNAANTASVNNLSCSAMEF